jgi:hypothetical protein
MGLGVEATLEDSQHSAMAGLRIFEMLRIIEGV